MRLVPLLAGTPDIFCANLYNPAKYPDLSDSSATHKKGSKALKVFEAI